MRLDNKRNIKESPIYVFNIRIRKKNRENF